MARPVVLACLAILACGREDAGKSKPTGSSGGPSPECAKAKVHGALKWIEDDYAAALACARSLDVPIVLDLWAPWCHTCLSMQTTVFTDPSFAALQNKFVFAALDTDREGNAAATAKFSLSAWPTFYVIDKNEQVLARFIGAATVAQFQEFLAAGQRAGAGGAAIADARLLGAERALATRDHETADEELTAALAAARPAWPRRAEALGALLMTKSKLGKVGDCVGLAERHMNEVGRSAIATSFWQTAFSCGKRHATEDANEHERSRKVMDQAVGKLQETVDDPEAPLSIDDRLEALGYLRDGLIDLERKAESAAVAEKQRALVDDAWAKAEAPFARMTFLWPRAEVYAHIARPLEVIPDFEKLAAALPKEYDPPARIGWLYMKAGKLDEAARWTDMALALVYGPRKGRLLAQRAEIARAAEDWLLERSYRAQAVALWQSLPPGQQNADALATAKTALEVSEAAARAALDAANKVPGKAPAKAAGTAR